MAKRLLSKKTKSGVKKYALAGYNMSGTSQALQNSANTTQKNPYMTEEQAAYEDKMFDYYGTKANKAKTDALRMQQEIEAADKEEVNSTLSSSANTLAKAAGKDMKAGTFGKFFVPKAVDAGLASSQAASAGVSAAAPTAASVGYAAPITTGIQSTAPSVLGSSAVAPSAGAVAFDTAAANTAATASQTAASTAPQMTNLASAGIGVGLNLAGTATERLTDDKSEYTNTKKERTGNIVGSGLKSAGTGVSIGTAVAGPIGGAIGGVIGAGVGVAKGIKENKANKKRAEELQSEQSKLASAYQSSYVNSRLTGNDTGFGYNSSTNMNNNFTSSYFQAKLGGAKKLPGGYEIPIGPNGEVKYVGNTHKEGGIMESANTEVENQETKDMVMMNTGKPKEYFFSEYLKLGGKSFSKIHEDMVKAGASQEQIQALAKKQEEVAGRDSKQVAMYGGPRKYQIAGTKIERGEGAPTYDLDPKNANASAEDLKKMFDTEYTDWTNKDELNNIAQTIGPNGRRFGKDNKYYKLIQDRALTLNAEDKSSGSWYDNTISKMNEAGLPTRPGNYSDPSKPASSEIGAEGPIRAQYKPGYNYATGPRAEEVVQEAGNTLSQDNATGEYIVRDANGNELSRSKDRVTAQKKASAGPPAPVNNSATPRTQEELQAEIQAERDKKLEEAANQASSVATYGTPKTTVAPTAWDGKVDTPQMAYDVNKPLLGKESMTTAEYDAAVAKYGLGIVDPQEATARAYDEYRDANSNTLTVQNDTDNADNLYNVENALARNYTGSIYDKDYNTIGYETAEESKRREAAEKTAATTTITKEGATETKDKLIGAKDPNLLPQFANAKTNPLWAPKNYGVWKDKVNTALNDEATATKVAEYIETYAGSTEPFAEQVKLRAAGKTGAELVKIIREEATDGEPGIFHEAVRLAIENAKPKEEPKKEDVKVEDVKDETPEKPIDARLQPCPTGQYRDAAGNCKQPMEPPADGINPTLIAGVSQLIPPIYGMVNRYQTAKGIPGVAGAPGVRGPLMPRVNLNRERDQSAKSNTAVRNFISSNNTGPGGIIAAMTANKDMNEQMLSIASKESAANKELAGEEAKLGMQASMFNAEQDLKRQGINADINQFNKKLEVGEKQYRREEIMGAIDTAVSRVAGVVKDERMYKATERLAKALDQTKSYDRYEVYEKFVKEKKKKGSPFANMSDYELRLMAAAIVGETTVVPPSDKEGEKGGENKKLGGVKKYVSRLGDLKYNKVKV